jgi:hypothetical protein
MHNNKPVLDFGSPSPCALLQLTPKRPNNAVRRRHKGQGRQSKGPNGQRAATGPRSYLFSYHLAICLKAVWDFGLPS